MLRRFLSIACCLCLPAAGCQQRPSEDELGTVIYEVPKVPGSEKTFELSPEAGPMPPDPEGEFSP